MCTIWSPNLMNNITWIILLKFTLTALSAFKIFVHNIQYISLFLYLFLNEWMFFRPTIISKYSKMLNTGKNIYTI